MKTLLSLLISLATLSPVFAQNQTRPIETQTIEEAFGVAFGHVFDESRSLGTQETTDGTIWFKIQPEKAYQALSEYYVLTTPKTKRVHRLWALGIFSSVAEANKEKAALLPLFESQYGPQSKNIGISGPGESGHFITGETSIHLIVPSHYPKPTILLYCVDKELDKLAKKEAMELQAETSKGTSRDRLTI